MVASTAARRFYASAGTRCEKLAWLFTSCNCFFTAQFFLGYTLFSNRRSKNVICERKQDAEILLVVLVVQFVVHAEELEKSEPLDKMTSRHVHVPMHVLVYHEVQDHCSNRAYHGVWR